MENTKPADTEKEPILAMAFVNMQPLTTLYDTEQSYRNGTLFPSLNKPFWKETEQI